MPTPKEHNEAQIERDTARTLADGLLSTVDKLREHIADLESQYRDADTAWQSATARIVHICQLLGVDFTCEEPETCEQVIERLLRKE